MIQQFADWLIYDRFGIAATTRLGEALNFFVYDSLKIVLLLFFICTVMGVVNAYFPVERLRNFLSSRQLYGTPYLMASLFGAITPFCSCSSIPLFIGFVKGGIPLGVTFSFLITSPLVNEVAVAMLAGTFGWRVTAIYVISGIVLGTIGGGILGKMKLEKHLSPWVLQIQQMANSTPEHLTNDTPTLIQRMPQIIKDAFGIIRGVMLYIIIGIAIGATMHGYVPEGFFEAYLSGEHWYAVPLAVVLAIPMYANAAGIVPVVEVFVAKGVSLGTALAFMMSVVGLSLPEATMLKKVMSLRLIGVFFAVVALFIILLGWLFNILL